LGFQYIYGDANVYSNSKPGPDNWLKLFGDLMGNNSQ